MSLPMQELLWSAIALQPASLMDGKYRSVWPKFIARLPEKALSYEQIYLCRRVQNWIVLLERTAASNSEIFVYFVRVSNPINIIMKGRIISTLEN